MSLALWLMTTCHVTLCYVILCHGRDTRELAFQQLQSVLASKDLELAKLQQRFTELISELNELRRVSKREGVNIDYLKNIVIQVFNVVVTVKVMLIVIAIIVFSYFTCMHANCHLYDI